jgi:hypothetical protein
MMSTAVGVSLENIVILPLSEAKRGNETFGGGTLGGIKASVFGGYTGLISHQTLNDSKHQRLKL